MFNQEETRFMYKLLPNVSNLAPNEKGNKSRGTKGMRSKVRITLSVLANATGTQILPLYFIGYHLIMISAVSKMSIITTRTHGCMVKDLKC